ncbi:hypothetical protein D9C73_021248 [Collichthys lucidus]|uniref:Uncharacterized protein n=2 Tax=Collichthys lucidus TaxID=240159 RepID=A0A4U5VFW9_COLLU|nr:hypothetical protein D9C73_021248 [Collichthys lucidus]
MLAVHQCQLATWHAAWSAGRINRRHGDRLASQKARDSDAVWQFTHSVQPHAVTYLTGPRREASSRLASSRHRRSELKLGRKETNKNLSEMSKDKLESLVKHMEETLSEMEQLKLHCGKQSEELSQLVLELRRENQELVEKYNQLAAEMKEAKEIIDQLQDTKYAFNAKERQAQKLNRQL